MAQGELIFSSLSFCTPKCWAYFHEQPRLVRNVVLFIVNQSLMIKYLDLVLGVV